MKGPDQANEDAMAMVAKQTAPLREEVQGRLMTVGVIPWAAVWPTAKPISNSSEASKVSDFVSIHLDTKAETWVRFHQAAKP